MGSPPASTFSTSAEKPVSSTRWPGSSRQVVAAEVPTEGIGEESGQKLDFE